MSLQSLFKYIRKEDVALWIGAGFSLYAGFPSGNKLREIIYNELTDDDKAQVDQNSSLRSIAGAFVTLKNGSRNELNRILKREFGKFPTATDNHDLLSKIPHFKSIVTTNYDSLIETSYLRRADVIRSDRDVPYIQNLRPVIYKPHGDLEATDRIIITENDYASFYNIKRDSPFWISILDVLSKKNLLFLGYGFEDENVWAWFDLIDNAIGNDRKERFLVAPNWPKLKIKQIEARHISYIDMSADQFLQELNEHLKLNIIADFENGIVSQDVFSQYVAFHDLNSKIITEDGKPKIETLYNNKKDILSKVKITISDKSIIKQLDKFNKGIGNSIKISKAHLHSFEHFIGGFRMNTEANGFDELCLERELTNYVCSIEFPDDDLILEDINFYLERLSKNQYSIKGNVLGYELKILLKYTKDGLLTKVTYTEPHIFPSISKCIQFQKLFLNYSKGSRTILHFNGHLRNITANNGETDFQFLNDALIFFENLRKIERQFSVSFKGLKTDYSPNIIKTASRLVDLINNKYLRMSVDNVKNGLVLKRREDVKDRVISDFSSEIYSLFIKTGEIEEIDFLGCKLNLGERGVEICDIEPLTYSDDRMTAIVKSRTGEYLQRYGALYPFDSVINVD